jgi:oxygen-independent coproporphyrinogen-3 oxidase
MIEAKAALNLTTNYDPRTWWREYPPKFTYSDKKLSPEIVKMYLAELVSCQEQNNIGIYIHLPFCESRCNFCKFYSEAVKDKVIIDEYLTCLEKEISLYGVNFRRIPIDNVYIGGGTPTLLNESQWCRLFTIIQNKLKLKKDPQILTEGTPETSDIKKLKLLCRYGVNRYTIGVQSFDDTVLKKTNRKGSAEDIRNSVMNARRAGIEYVNLDILLGLPGETWQTYVGILENINNLKPDCVSFMTLDLGRGVELVQTMDISKNFFFSESLKSKIFSFLGFGLEEMGYKKIQGFSGSTYILRGREGSVNHNLLNRNKLYPVIGFGSTAESAIGQLKYTITSHLKEYTGSINSGKLPNFSGIVLSEDEYIRRYIIYRYILWKKIDRKEFKNKFGTTVEEVFNEKFSKLAKEYKFLKTEKDLIFLPSLEMIKGNTKYKKRNYGKQERDFLFCFKYFYSSAVIDKFKLYESYKD